MIVHHCGVDGTRPRGHTSLTGAADAQLAVSRDAADNIVVTVEWMKDGPEGDIITSRLEQVDLGKDVDGETVKSCVIVPAEGDIGQATQERKVRGAKKVALDQLRKAIDEAGSVPPTSNHIPPNTRTISVETWRNYAYQGTITESDKPDSRQKAFVRAAKDLQAAGTHRKMGRSRVAHLKPDKPDKAGHSRFCPATPYPDRHGHHPQGCPFVRCLSSRQARCSRHNEVATKPKTLAPNLSCWLLSGSKEQADHDREPSHSGPSLRGSAVKAHRALAQRFPAENQVRSPGAPVVPDRRPREARLSGPTY